jgi:hypothetical protein
VTTVISNGIQRLTTTNNETDVKRRENGLRFDTCVEETRERVGPDFWSLARETWKSFQPGSFSHCLPLIRLQC